MQNNNTLQIDVIPKEPHRFKIAKEPPVFINVSATSSNTFQFWCILPTMHHLLSSQHKHSISQSNPSVIPSVSLHFFFFFHKAMALHRNPTIILAVHLLFRGAIELQVCGFFTDSTGVRSHPPVFFICIIHSNHRRKKSWKTSQMQQLTFIYICCLLVNTSTAFASVTNAVCHSDCCCLDIHFAVYPN